MLAGKQNISGGLTVLVLQLPKLALYQTELHPDMKLFILYRILQGNAIKKLDGFSANGKRISYPWESIAAL